MWHSRKIRKHSDEKKTFGTRLRMMSRCRRWLSDFFKSIPKKGVRTRSKVQTRLSPDGEIVNHFYSIFFHDSSPEYADLNRVVSSGLSPKVLKLHSSGAFGHIFQNCRSFVFEFYSVSAFEAFSLFFSKSSTSSVAHFASHRLQYCCSFVRTSGLNLMHCEIRVNYLAYF